MPKQQTIVNILKKIENNHSDPQNYSPTILRLVRLGHHLRQNVAQVIVKYDLQHGDFGVLATLSREKAPYCLSPTEIYSAMLCSSGGLTKVLNRVTNAGLIERIDNPEDKRSKLVQLTETGKQLTDKITRELHSKEHKLMGILSDTEQQQLDDLLAKLLHVWE